MRFTRAIRVLRMSNPQQSTLDTALRQLNKKWAGRDGVVRVSLQSDEHGRPLFFFCGPSERPADILPNGMVVPDPMGRPFRVPIGWRREDTGSVYTNQSLTKTGAPELFNPQPDAVRPLDPLKNEDIDKAYWWFFTPTPKRQLDVVNPAFHAMVDPVLGAIPPPDHIAPVMFFDARLPQYDMPNFWAKAYEPYGCLCCTFYTRPTIVYQYTVPEDYMLVINGICFTTTCDIGPGETFLIEIMRNGAMILAFEEVLIDPANPDPSQRWLFTGCSLPLPLWIRFDRNETITVRITPLGLFPFTKSTYDTFCCTVCVLLHGWLGSLMDNRDGAARPVDVGGNRDFMGDEVTKDAWVIDELPARAKLLQQWLTEAVGYVK